MRIGIKFLYLPLPDGSKYVLPLDEGPSFYYYMLTNYITAHVGSKRACEEVFEWIKDVEDGKVEEDDIGGNVCSAWMTKDEVEISKSIGGRVITVYPLWIFKKAVQEWYDFLQTGREREIEFDYTPSPDAVKSLT